MDCGRGGKRLPARGMSVTVSASSPFAAIIVAAGKGLRAGQPLPKQFAPWRGMPLLRHSALALADAGACTILVAIPDGADELAGAALEGIDGAICITGGETRQESVRNALERLSANPAPLVLIHDAARPRIPQQVITRLLDALERHPAAIPVLPVVDSLALDEAGLMAGSARREELRRVQTPQAFHFYALLAAHRAWPGAPDAGADAQVARAAGFAVALVEGADALRKLTYAEDFMNPASPVRIGTGFDVHRLVAGEELWLCGLKIPHDKGLAGHSDADVALHALVDALLGAIGAGDIGIHFPPSDPKWRGAASSRFVAHAVELVGAAGYRIGNIDLTLICEAPRLGPHRDAMCENVARLCAVDIAAVNVKATTTERLGFTGRGEGIAAQAAVTVCC